jgi:geranylgeranyl diphosphate synthase, type II
MFELKTYLSEKRLWMNRALEEQLSAATLPGRLADAMRYAVMAGGKRLRPVLCAAAAEAVGEKPDDAVLLRAACSLEFIHTYSLIHDDLPAMDDDTLRRGKPTCHIAFDEATAILAGDALLTLAFQVLSSGVALPGGPDPGDWIRVIQCIAEAAGALGMVEGQMRDIASEGVALSLEALESLHGLKTGALIRASVTTGAILAQAEREQADALETYAHHIGMAFQVADDILNEAGDAGLMGKAVGTDRARGKNTYPALLGLTEAREKARIHVESALGALASFGDRATPLRAIARYVIERNR